PVCFIFRHRHDGILGELGLAPLEKKRDRLSIGHCGKSAKERLRDRSPVQPKKELRHGFGRDVHREQDAVRVNIAWNLKQKPDSVSNQLQYGLAIVRPQYRCITTGALTPSI